MTNKRERMSEDRLKELRRRGGLWTVEHALEFIREIDALKAEVREKDEQLEALGQLQIGQMEELHKAEAEVARLQVVVEAAENLLRKVDDWPQAGRAEKHLRSALDTLRGGKDGE